MLYPLLRPLIFRLDAERAHRLSILALQLGPVAPPPADGPLATTVAGIRFPNPLGMAPGYDKDAEVPDAVLGLGFGSVEIGTVTPRPQPGNPRPRLFRLEEDRAVINRMGFNNGGLQAAHLRLSARKRQGVVGVNVGANKDAADRVADYVTGLSTMAPVADYLTINISSPNTPGLRDMQGDKELEDLLCAVAAARESGWPPIFLKVAPDLDNDAPARIVAAVMKHGIDGIIVSNTTITRPPLQSRHAGEAGGISGAPLHDLALQRLRDFRKASEGRLPLIGVGGIATAEQAWARIRAGASLVQLYSAMVYEGPGIARAILPRLETLMRQDGFTSIAEAVGSE
ncbi:quinone-dependent dihydroorotate dehydrogenase [Novosphingobium sp.]|uniref:quinone-dependent dihydroorotate dehydrogenase n=1 Tax=Novosphingobium sp. TaxID=1874826 RepID=UPI00286D7121|nr:quinone-dependent dihydroorotate dehydrogenase [Novosphingobium sp.]